MKNLDMAKIFRSAHRLTRRTVKKFNCDYRATFAAALKNAIKEARCISLKLLEFYDISNYWFSKDEKIKRVYTSASVIQKVLGIEIPKDRFYSKFYFDFNTDAIYMKAGDEITVLFQQ